MFFNLLTLVFVVAQILGYIQWSWWLVLAPTLIHVTIMLGFIGVALWATSDTKHRKY